MYENILYAKENGVATITLNRPDTANGFSVALGAEVIDALLEARDDDDVYVILFKGNGKIFSAGGDISEMRKIVETKNTDQMRRMVEGVADVSMLIKEIPKPVVFMVTGAVAGAAFNMALAADFCIATENVKFIQAFVNVGLAPDGGGLYLLSKSVGINKAIQLAMTGEPVSAEEGKRLGFVYKVSKPEDIERETDELVRRLLEGPKNSYATMKAMLWESTFRDWKKYTSLEVSMQTSLSKEVDFKEGVMAFLEKRKAKFK